MEEVRTRLPPLLPPCLIRAAGNIGDGGDGDIARDGAGDGFMASSPTWSINDTPLKEGEARETGCDGGFGCLRAVVDVDGDIGVFWSATCTSCVSRIMDIERFSDLCRVGNPVAAAAMP